MHVFGTSNHLVVWVLSFPESMIQSENTECFWWKRILKLGRERCKREGMCLKKKTKNKNSKIAKLAEY